MILVLFFGIFQSICENFMRKWYASSDQFAWMPTKKRKKKTLKKKLNYSLKYKKSLKSSFKDSIWYE